MSVCWMVGLPANVPPRRKHPAVSIGNAIPQQAVSPEIENPCVQAFITNSKA